MKTFIIALFSISLLAFAGCSMTHPAAGVKADSETVMVTYHVQPGKEAEFQALLAHAWDVYHSGRLVNAQPHTVVRYAEDDDKTKFVEIFTWVKSPDHPPESVQAIWKQEEALCEARDGHRGIEGGEVELVTGK
ncbi:MAG TPA: hypothetical protein VNV43_09205 [Candidatus Acidoferrales bacterium]|nr:hypothetical protein [Candidatus Acidoferrales bacterium]